MQGHRVDDAHAVWDGEPGGYFLTEDRSILWVKVPSGESVRLPVREGPDPGQNEPPVWGFTEESDGTITVTPSINVHSAPSVKGWHGFLRAGVWSPA